MDVGKRFVGPVLLSGAAATIYTVPDLAVAHILHIHVFNQDALSVNFTLSVGADTAGTRLWDAFPIATKTALDWSGLLVVSAGEIIQAFGSAANDLNITISGVEIS